MTDSWITKEPHYLPDFIIGGAMKSGTTTLHAILDRHSDVSIAKDELGFFDMDDLMVHQDFNFHDSKTCTWTTQDLTQDPKHFWNWYHSKFKDLPNRLKGEDSTTYLASSWAAKRLAKQTKPIKLIFVLRHPTKRSISNYLHALKSGRALFSLEKTLIHYPQSILARSLYKTQLETYYKYFPQDSIKIVLFEDLVANPKACIEDLCIFLSLDATQFKERDFIVHSNKTKIPKYIKMQVLRNRLLLGLGAQRYSKFLPFEPPLPKSPSVMLRGIDKLHSLVNPMSTEYTFSVKDSTLTFLDSYFKKELQGIDELTGLSIYERWFGD